MRGVEGGVTLIRINCMRKKLFSMKGRKEHLSPSERARCKLLSRLQAVQCECVPGFQLHELSHTLGQALMVQLSLSHFPSCEQLIIHIPVTNPIKLIGASSWTLVVSVLWSILSSLSSVSRCVSSVSPKKSLVTPCHGFLSVLS